MAAVEKTYTILWYLDGEELGTSTFSSQTQSVDNLGLSLLYPYELKNRCGLRYTSDTIYYTYSVDIDATKGEFTTDSVNDTIVVRNFSLVRKSVDLTTLSGWEDLSDGEHTITIKAKASGYADSNASESVVVTKSSSSGETWVLNEEPDTGNVSKTEINFKSNNTNYVAIEANTMNAGPQSMYYYKDSSTYDVAREYGTWSNESYKTITFETAPTGDLLTWLQANGTKQSGSGKVSLSLPEISTDMTADDNWELQQTTIEVDSTIKTAIETFNESDMSNTSFNAFIDAVINLTTDDTEKEALNDLKEQIEGTYFLTEIGIHPVAIKTIAPYDGEYLITITTAELVDSSSDLQVMIYDYVTNTLERKDELEYDPRVGEIQVYIPKTNGDLLLIPFANE